MSLWKTVISDRWSPRTLPIISMDLCHVMIRSVHWDVKVSAYWNEGKSCMGLGRRAIQEVKQVSNATRSKTPWDALCRSVTFRSLAVHFSIAKFPNSHQDAQLCTTIFTKNPRMLNTMWTLMQTCTLMIPTTPFTRTCASRIAHCLRQASLIFRQVEILLAHSLTIKVD